MVENGLCKVSLHNGYLEFGYGCPVNSVNLNFDEYVETRNSILKLVKTSFFDDFENNDAFQMHIPSDIQSFWGDYTILTIAEENSCIYTDDRSICIEKKNKIFEQLKELTKSKI